MQEDNKDLKEDLKEELLDEEIKAHESKCETSDDLQLEIDSLKNQLIRLQADFTNFKNRSKKSEADSVSIGVEKMAEAIFPVVDNFEIALSHMGESGDKEGVNMIYNQLLEALASQGIMRMDSDGALFDLNMHYAIMMEEGTDTEPNHISETIKAGYTRGEKVLRPAMVKVAK